MSFINFGWKFYIQGHTINLGSSCKSRIGKNVFLEGSELLVGIWLLLFVVLRLEQWTCNNIQSHHSE